MEQQRVDLDERLLPHQQLRRPDSTTAAGDAGRRRDRAVIRRRKPRLPEQPLDRLAGARFLAATATRWCPASASRSRADDLVPRRPASRQHVLEHRRRRRGRRGARAPLRAAAPPTAAAPHGAPSAPRATRSRDRAAPPAPRGGRPTRDALPCARQPLLAWASAATAARPARLTSAAREDPRRRARRRMPARRSRRGPARRLAASSRRNVPRAAGVANAPTAADADRARCRRRS